MMTVLQSHYQLRKKKKNKTRKNLGGERERERVISYRLISSNCFRKYLIIPQIVFFICKKDG